MITALPGFEYVIAQNNQPELGQNAPVCSIAPTHPNPDRSRRPAERFVKHPNRSLVLTIITSIQFRNPYRGSLLSEHLPPHARLVISTRADPPFPIVRLRAHNLLTEIREAI
jgi:hypothetical protein